MLLATLTSRWSMLVARDTHHQMGQHGVVIPAAEPRIR